MRFGLGHFFNAESARLALDRDVDRCTGYWHRDEMVSLTSVLPDNNVEKAKQEDGAASIFSDDRGNLRFVNLVVRRPIFVFVCTLSTCMLLTAVLLRVVFANGNPITDDQAMYDVNDPRSIAWDSIRLTLGTNESILICVLAGFSVDYVVHLAHAYVCSKSRDGADKIRDAFGDMGMSVFNGMATSVIASVPLFLCTLAFFVKFGTFLCLTIAFSWLFANLGFMSCLAQIGGCGQKSSVGDSEAMAGADGEGGGGAGTLTTEAVVC